jgi:hypothetical protein
MASIALKQVAWPHWQTSEEEKTATKAKASTTPEVQLRMYRIILETPHRQAACRCIQRHKPHDLRR